MNWKNFEIEKPKSSGVFLISIRNNQHSFSYLSYYNSDVDTWHLYDALTDKVGEIIKLEVVGYLEGLTTFIG